MTNETILKLLETLIKKTARSRVEWKQSQIKKNQFEFSTSSSTLKIQESKPNIYEFSITDDKGNNLFIHSTNPKPNPKYNLTSNFTNFSYVEHNLEDAITDHIILLYKTIQDYVLNSQQIIQDILKDIDRL